jgi:putative transposase
MPSPQALAITLSKRQQSLLEQMVRHTTNAYRLVRRAQLVLLAAQGADNTEIGQRLQLSRSRVRLWRQRWIRAVESLDAAEAEGISDQGLLRRILEVLSDQLRPGTPSQFSVEQIVQIVALACESPQNAQRPVNQWTPTELAQEAVKRGIVEQISPRSVGRFLKRGNLATPS